MCNGAQLPLPQCTTPNAAFNIYVNLVGPNTNVRTQMGAFSKYLGQQNTHRILKDVKELVEGVKSCGRKSHKCFLYITYKIK